MSDQTRRSQFVFRRDSLRNAKLTRTQIVEGLKKFARVKSHQPFTMKEFDSWKDKPVCASTVHKYFGSWTNAMKAAGLRPKLVMKLNVYDMVETFQRCWIENESEPTRKRFEDYLRRNASPYRWNSYRHYFGSLGRLAQRIVDYQEGKISKEQLLERHKASRRRTSVPLKVRYQVLKRDGECCVKCGASPETDRRVRLEVDHIVPVSKGGTDSLDNLQTLCSLCNQGKKARDN